MKNRKVLYVLQMALGIGLILIGNFVFVSDSVKIYSGLCIGLGSAVLALGAGWLIQSFMISAVEDAALRKFKAIQVNDERNIRIREKTGHMVARIMNYTLSIFVLTLAFMGADLIIIIMAVALIIIQFVLAVIFSNYYAKVM